jgi:hypothetical protein
VTRLPTRDDLGGLPSALTGRPISRLNQSVADTSAKGRGMASFGKELAGLADVMHRKAEADSEYETELRYQEFQFDQEKQLSETLRNTQPGQAAGIADNVTTGYQERAKEFFASVPEHLKEKYDARLFDQERSVYGTTRQFELKEQSRASVQRLEDHKTKLSQSDNIEDAREKYKRALELNPDLTPIQKDELARKHLEDMDESYIRRQIEAGRDIEGIVKELEKPGYVKPEASAEEPDGPLDPKLAKRATVRHNNPGGMWPGRSASKFGSTEAERLSDGQGNKIASFATKEEGGAALFDLMSSRYSGMTLKKAIAKWSGGNNVGSYLSMIGKRTGLSPDDVITEEYLKDPATGIAFAKAMAAHETGGEYPMSDAAWGKAHAMAFGGTPSGNVRVADASGRTVTDASKEGEADPSEVGRFPYLSTEKRTQLLTMAKTKLSESRISEYWQADNRVSGAIKMMEEQGEAPKGFDLDSNLAIIKAAKQETKAERYAIEMAEAKEVYKARFAEDGRPLEEMSEPELRSHLTRLTEAKTKVADPAEFGLKDRILKSVTDKVEKLTKLREKDAALSVTNAPEVKAAMAQVTAENPNWETIIEARLAAQRRLGIDPEDQRGLTEAEAKALLPSTGFARMDQKEVLETITSAANAAQSTYGSFAGRAMDDAINFFVKDQQAYETAKGVLAKFAKGQDITRRDLRQMDDLGRIESAEKAFRMGTGERFGPYGFESRATPEPLGPRASEYTPKPKIQPSEDALGYLLKNPDTARLFDEWHNGGETTGDNSAAAWIAKLSKQKVRN